jgi:predicted phage tail component-like protein
MSMYEFVDTIQQTPGTLLPSEAMNFNGVFIEDEIDGYRTLTVSGREGINTDISTFKLNRTRGSWVSSTTLPSRLLTVYYHLEASNPTELMHKWHRLNLLLAVNSRGVPNQNVEIFFRDDPEIVYYGIKENMELPTAGQTSVSSSFTLFCGDPVKYSKHNVSDILWGNAEIDFQAHYTLGNQGSGAFNKKITRNTSIATTVEGMAVKPTIKLSGSGVDVKITCAGKNIDVGTFSSTTLEIDTEMFVAYFNGTEKIVDMDDFWLEPDDTVFITGRNMNFDLTIDFRNQLI